MIIVAPGSHPQADKVWKEMLKGKPNGARTLGAAQEKYLAPLFEQAGYDMLITYAADFDIEIPDGVKKVAVMWHQNWPIVDSIRAWQRANYKLWILKGLEVDYFCNEDFVITNIQDVGGRASYLPRFIDTTKYPKPNKEKTIDTLWFSNRWGVWAAAFDEYLNSVDDPVWISHGTIGRGKRELKQLTRKETLDIVNRAKTVWSLGISQLEAQYFGAEIVSFRGEPLEFYDQRTIVPYTKELLEKINGSY